MKNIFHGRFQNVASKLRSSDSDSLSLPSYAESLYQSSKIDKEIYYELYKMMSSLCVQNYSVSDDRKMKKSSWESLSSLLYESEKKIAEDTLTKEIMDSSIKAFDEMARNTKEFEKTISLNVIKHFHDLSEDNILGNTKKTLSSLCKDMKSNADKVQILQNQLNNQPSEPLSFRKAAEVNNIASIENKLLLAQTTEENTLKECGIKQDLYLSKLFAAEFAKITTAEKVLEFFQDYVRYYADCQQTLMNFIPELQSSIDRHKLFYAFRVPLEEHLSSTNRKLSYVLETCIQQLDNEETLQHEGIFRISGSRSKMELLKNALNVMRVDEFVTKGCNSAVFTGVLKQYLRELPNPLMTYELYDQWCEVGAKIRQNDIEGTMLLIKECLSMLPICYYDNLVYLMQFLKKISMYESVNKMSSSNLGLMLGPNLIRNKHTSNSEDCEASAYSMLGSPGGTVLDFMISHFNELFPNCPVYVTTPKVIITVPGVTSDNNIIEKEAEKDDIKKPKMTKNDEYVPYGDIKLDGSIDSADSGHKFSRDQPSHRQRSFRKPKAPLPPQTKPYVINNETDSVTEVISLRSSSRPTITKRMSKLEKSVTDPVKNSEEMQNEAQNTLTVSRPIQAPSIPSIKQNAAGQDDVVDKPIRPDNPSIKRPNNVPPPIPSFNKLKENLVSKNPESARKHSLHDQSLSSSLQQDLSSSTSNITKKHQHSSSDVSHTSF